MSDFERIWLQTTDEHGEATWCQNKINDDDIEYVRVGLYAALKQLVEKQFLFNGVFMERFHFYARHSHDCTYDQLDKGDICTCGLQGLITMYYEIRDALLTEDHDEQT